MKCDSIDVVGIRVVTQVMAHNLKNIKNENYKFIWINISYGNIISYWTASKQADNSKWKQDSKLKCRYERKNNSKWNMSSIFTPLLLCGYLLSLFALSRSNMVGAKIGFIKRNPQWHGKWCSGQRCQLQHKMVPQKISTQQKIMILKIPAYLPKQQSTIGMKM